MSNNLRAEFIRFCVEAGILRFGEFRTKAGRLSPYFFNAGLFCDGVLLDRLGDFYARTLLAAEQTDGLRFDLLYGPAYKGITLASATAIKLAQHGRRVPFVYNRKEAKDHGEGGVLVGAPMQGRVVIVDDVISAGTSVRESVALITEAGATPCAVLIALDRQERGGEEALSAVQQVSRNHGIPVYPIARLDDLLSLLDSGDQPALAVHRDRVAAYRARYGTD
ncbi:MAG: orotate phosphoribosyltransferase [Burkholderiaceae bacterium]